MISPSILSCDFTNVKKDFDAMNEAKADFVHIDIMDGNYVPNISFGPSIVSQFRKLTDIDFDVHLMINEPEKYIEDFVKAGANIITIHPDSTLHLNRTINLIKSFGIKAGIAINPAQELSILDYTLEDIDLVLIMSVNPGFGGQSFIESSTRKVEDVKKIINNAKSKCLIEVDGGIKLNNALKVYNAGADILVAGSAIFGSENPKKTIIKFKELLK
ncbi:ribulose-phosphate 3-epimerase [Peptoniphilus sp. oral taxon 386]|uniref:ribulose-phosphate 3-epimerase n=1 Tax=Peptoniphilus sp. oral taxon 386 TaxID=652713 RepID=UPI0001DA9C0E|nr:ribulose-phosphate 3-epimerase [Peptoniphilus sp. oral taxon 386]EFI42203.1 ribulose-phosphate 3-epimerase [Peptoniphilus sp. oral taxon 386 str. F0131]